MYPIAVQKLQATFKPSIYADELESYFSRGLKRMGFFYFQAGVGGSKETDSRGRTVAEG